VTVFELLTLAYPEPVLAHGGCIGVNNTGVLSGGPAWVKSDLWQIQAAIPAGTPSYTWAQLSAGEAPEIQKMLQALLVDRFKLAVHREVKETPVLLLTVAEGGPKFNGIINLGRRIVFEGDGGKLVGPEEVKGAAKQWLNRDDSGRTVVKYATFNIRLSEWAPTLSRNLGRPVLDRTGLSGEFTFHFEYDPSGVTRPILAKALEGVGLKLEEARASIELWTIENVERPSEN
jgi:uncharacterized protein (TIGR03435 family)